MGDRRAGGTLPTHGNDHVVGDGGRKVVAHARMLLHAVLGLLLAWAKMGLDWVLGIHGEVYSGRLEAGDVGGRWIVGLGLGGHTAGEVLAGLLGKELG